MKLIIHDLDEEEFKNIFSEPDEDVVLIGNSGEILNCIGCFGCWIKTPGKCIIRDQYGDMGELLARCEEARIISRCCYGGYSPFVKNVLDRSIPYLHPYFKIKNGEMHHKQRYDKILKLNNTVFQHF